jgi:hypothetical protein
VLIYPSSYQLLASSRRLSASDQGITGKIPFAGNRNERM